jgi:cytochrome bd-type quinol oxidase subunit 1
MTLTKRNLKENIETSLNFFFLSLYMVRIISTLYFILLFVRSGPDKDKKEINKDVSFSSLIF